ncbi:MULTISPECIES: Ig-like domain-containing protein [unclassified Curtobacterium]|uniref:Ig-like domain-containing protein n=1 Tax=unclassified Curtobacterium TaxID=257496 RepID=UPI00226B0AF6|nr:MULTISPECIES: Ig-like domain-containing protein [unclassified Curtobacterium]
MSHKKRASTALKSMGAAGLAAATIVSGLSFGAPAALAEPTVSAASPVSLGTAPFYFKYGSGYAALRDAALPYEAGFYGQLRTYTTKAAAEAAAPRVTVYKFDDGSVSFKDNNNGCVYMAVHDNAVFGKGIGVSSSSVTTSPCTNAAGQFRISDSGRLTNVSYNEALGTMRTGAAAPSVGLQKMFLGGSCYEFSGVSELVEASEKRALSAAVGTVNNLAKTAVVSGTATPGAKVSIGEQSADVGTDGKWSMTVSGLAAGKSDLVAIQKIDGTEFDRKTVSATIVEGGGLFGVDQGPVELKRGETTQVPFVVENRVSRTGTKGTVTLTAPDGATFSEQDTVQGSWRRVGNTAWNASTSIPLSNGRLSDDNTTLTFDADWASERAADQQYRFMIDVTAAADAPEGSSAMDFDFSGTSSTNDFRAQGSTTTTVGTSVVDLVANIGSIDHAGKTAVISGSATPGATITIGDKSVEADAETGAWSITVDDLDRGTNPLHVVQEIDGEEHDSKDLEVVINDATISGQDGTAITLERGEVTSVESLFKTNGSISRPQGKVEFTAPEGTTFAEDQGRIEGSFKKPGEDAWTNSAMTLTNGVRSEDGTKYTYDFATTTTTWNLPDASLMRWNIDVNTPEGAAAGKPSMSTKLTGTATEGSYDTTSTTATTIEANGPAAPSATGFFDADVEAWAGIRGTGEANAAITVKNAAGDTIATTTANSSGAYTVRIDPSKVGYGKQDLTVTQTVEDQESDGVAVELDYGQNTPVISTPADGSTIGNTDFRFTGTGNTGGKLVLSGNDFSDSTDIGTTTVADDAWSITNSDLTLPTGPYQFWAAQFTKGGKVEVTGTNITVNRNAPSAPTEVEGYFSQDVTQWAGIRGKGEANADITVKNAAGDTIATGTANGTGAFDIVIDPSKVGYGKQDFTVTQTVDSQESTGAAASLDYGQNDPAFTTPANGSTIGNKDLSFTGTGNTGGLLKVWGNDLGAGDDTQLGSTTVANDAWAVSNTDVTLTPGNYQFWLGQFTKGGKVVVKGTNVTVEQARPAAPTARGEFAADVTQWASVRGTGAPGATVTVKDTAGNVVAETTITDPSGIYSVAIDPSKVGFGKQDLSVSQTLNGATSDAVTVELDYGQNDPAFTTPENGSTIGNKDLSFTGTGNTGGLLKVWGNDLGTGDDTQLGSTTVANDAWAVSNTDITLTTGNYQFWLGQFTKGGKVVVKGTNVTVEQARTAAPTAEGYFKTDVNAWAAIRGQGLTGATISVKDASGTEIATTTITDPNGYYDLGIDPSKVGWGKQQLTVTQTLNGSTSTGIGVELDYGVQGDFAVTSPENLSTVSGQGGFTFTGTGLTGAEIQVSGTDFSNSTPFGSTTVVDGSWSLASTLDLREGPYQFWASQHTKGGKYQMAGINVTVQR